MPWKKKSAKQELRLEFMKLLDTGNYYVTELAMHFGISRKTAYKWIKRYREGGNGALQDGSRIPHSHPNKTPAKIEAVIVKTRKENPTWGPRTILGWMKQHKANLHRPSASTVARILQRNGLL